MPYVEGDFWRICDRCGNKYRQSVTKKTWDNLIVCERCFETRHPQDFVKGKKDSQSVPNPRVRPVYKFI
jgi:hypothetical protein